MISHNLLLLAEIAHILLNKYNNLPIQSKRNNAILNTKSNANCNNNEQSHYIIKNSNKFSSWFKSIIYEG